MDTLYYIRQSRSAPLFKMSCLNVSQWWGAKLNAADRAAEEMTQASDFSLDSETGIGLSYTVKISGKRLHQYTFGTIRVLPGMMGVRISAVR